MATTIGSLALKISALTGPLRPQLAEASGMIGDFAATASKKLKSIRGFGFDLFKHGVTGGNPFTDLENAALGLASKLPIVGGAIGTIAGLADGFWQKLKSTIDGMIETGKEARRLGTDVETMSGLLAFAGGDSEKLVAGLTKFQNKLGDATMGSKEAEKTFRRLGLDVEELAAMPLDKAFGVLADHFQRIENGAQRTHFAISLFGKAGAELGPLLAKGSAGMEFAIERAKQLGLTFSETDLAAAQAAKKGMKEFDGIMKGIWTQTAIKALPFIRAFQEELKKSGVTAANVADGIFQAGSAIVKAAVEAYNFWHKFLGVLEALNLAAKGVAAGMIEVALAALRTEEALRFGSNDWAQKTIADLEKREAAIGGMIEESLGKIKEHFAKGVDADAVLKDLEAFRQKFLKKKGQIEGEPIDLAKTARFAEMVDKAAQRLDAMKSPFSKWVEDLQEMQAWLKAGVVDADEFDKLVSKSTLDLLNQNRAAENKPPAALTRGTAAEFSEVNAFQRGQGHANPLEALKNLAEQQKKEEEKIVKNTKDLLDEIKKGQLLKVLGRN